jgi:hypothetical protein
MAEATRLAGRLAEQTTSTETGELAESVPVATQVVHDSRQCALYRHFDADGVLLYVGISYDPYVRYTSGHEVFSAWSRFSSEFRVEWLPDREEARAAEVQAIKEEKPLFNQRGAEFYDKTAVVEYLIRHDALDLLVPHPSNQRVKRG